MPTILGSRPAGRGVMWLLAAVLFLSSAAFSARAAERVTISVASRVRASGETSLLVEARGLAGQVADEVTVGLPSKIVSRVTPAHLPEGWSAARDGSSLRLSGPAAPLPLWVRLDATGVEAPARVNVHVRLKGAKVFEGDVNVTRAPPVKLVTNLEGVLALPKTLAAGDRITFEPLDAARTPAGGRWVVAGMPAQEVAASGRSGSSFGVRIAETARAGDAISVAYADPWGERVVDVPTAARCGGNAPPSGAGKPRIEACAPMAFAGQAACVCGLFPTDASREGLTLNGKPLGAPATASSGVLFVRIPAETASGPARIGGLESAGFSPTDQATVTVLRVGGEIDRSKLMRGENTPMRLWLEGTAQPLSLHVRNETPEIIRIEGGDDQNAVTDGKTPNGLKRTVYAVGVGDFHITYSLTADACPCSGDTPPTQHDVPPTEVRPTPTVTPIPGQNVYPTYPPELRTREKSPSPSPSPTPATSVGGTQSRDQTPPPATPNGHTVSRDKTPPPPITPTVPPPPPTYTPPPPTPPPHKPECKVTYKVEGGPGISIDAVVAAPPATSKKNEPIPLYVSASDMDQLLQTCTCFIDGVEVSATHKYIDVPDTVQYRWLQSNGKGTLAGKVGPATLYQPPALKVGESDSATIQAQMVDARDNDKPAYVTFTITVKREEECKYRRTLSAEKKSDPGRKKAITDPGQGVTCDPQEPSWDKEPVPLQATVPGKQKVCVGERVLLTASGSDEDLLTLKCQGRCGSDLTRPSFDDPVKYTWRADKGGFPDYGGGAKTNSDSTSAIYVAPSKPGPDVVHVHVEDSGKEAPDTPVDKTIPITAYKLDMLVDGDKDESAPDCDAYYICLNDDDDDEKGVDDRQPEPEKVAGEEDRVKITLKMEPEKSGNVILEASAGGQRIRVWTAQTGGKRVSLPYTVPKLPVDLWVEGIEASAVTRDVDLVLRSDDPHCEVHRLFTVEGPELDMDGVDHPKRMNPGGSVCVNKNFENDPTKQVMDKDNPVADPDKEHDLVRITLDKKPREGSVTFDVPIGGNRVRVWEKSADGKNLKGSRAEGKSYNAADLPVTLLVEGVAASGSARDVRLRLTDDDSGCVSLVQVTVVEVELKASMRDRAGGFVPVAQADREKKGAFIAVNEDDDDANGTLDVRQHPVPGEDDLLRLEVDIKPKPATGKVTLQATAGSDRVQLWLESDKGTALDLVNGVTFGANVLPRTFWLEGFFASAVPRDVELTLRCTEPRPCEDKLKATAVTLHLQTDLDMDGIIDMKDWKLERPKGAYIVVNNDDDDGDGIVDLNDPAVRVLGVPPVPPGTPVEGDLKKFEIHGPLPAALLNEGKVVLRRSNGNVRVYFDASKGIFANEFQLLGSPTPAGYAAGVEGNGVKTWDLSDPTQRAQFLAVRSTLWVEGVQASGAERDTSLSLSYVPKDAAVEIEMNQVAVTVVQFDHIEATTHATPAHTTRGNAPADQTFRNATGGIVSWLCDSAGPDRMFDVGRALVLVRNSDDAVDLVVSEKPALPVRWDVKRSPDDAPALGAAVPEIKKTAGLNMSLGTDETGSFYVFAYYDVNGNNKFDAGEPRIILPLILVNTTFRADVSATHNVTTATRVGTAANWTAAGRGVFVSSGQVGPGGAVPQNLGFNVNNPNAAAIYLGATVDFVGGGPAGLRGLDRTYGAWINNEIALEDVTGLYQNGHTVLSVFSTTAGPFVPGGAAPAIIAPPFLDAGWQNAAGAWSGGLGGPSAWLNSGRHGTTVNQPLGQRVLVETVDSPAQQYSGTHPGFAGSRLTGYRFNMWFRSYLAVWSDIRPVVNYAATTRSTERTYSILYEVPWNIQGEWTVDASGLSTRVSAPTVTMGRTTTHDPRDRASRTGVEVRFPVGLSLLQDDARN